MKIQLVTKPLSEINTEYIALPVFEEEKSPFNGIVGDFLQDNPKFGKLYETQLLYSKNKKLLLVGASKKEKLNFEKLQNFVGTACKTVAKKTKEIAVYMPLTDALTPEETGLAASIGAELALYDPTKNYKSKTEDDKLTSVQIVVQRADRGYQEGLKKGQIIAENINMARVLSDRPANELTPTEFLNTVKKVARESKLKLTVLDEKQAKKKGMGAFCGVAQGSDEPSFMIALEYRGDIKSKEKWGICGKGITYDTGGLSLKPNDAMLGMHYDMCGAAVALAVIAILAKLGVKTNLVSVMAVTENFPSGKAQRPGDIVRTYAGLTAEILNTDAEGRLVLADAITFAQKDFKATKIIDLATLTGGMIVALGDFITGAFGNDPKFTQNLIASGTKTGERIWEMPMDEEFNEYVKSDVADLRNIGRGMSNPRAAHAHMGAKFLEPFIEKGHPWVHLDIAGTATDMKKRPFKNPGATGVGIKTLVKLISQ